MEEKGSVSKGWMMDTRGKDTLKRNSDKRRMKQED